MDFGEVLQRAWKIIWKHKALWIFGILAGCGSSGNGGSGGSGSSGLQFTGNNSDFGNLPGQWRFFFYQVGQFFQNIPAWVWILLAVLLVLLIILAIVLNTIGRIGLIQGASQADEDENTHLSFGPLFSASLPYFWRVFLLDLLVFLFFLVLIAILTIPLILLVAGTMGIILLCLIPLICLLVPIGWIIGVIIEQATIAIVVENQGIFSGLQRGWNVVFRNLGAVIVIGLILLIISAILSFLITIPAVIIIIPPILGLVFNTSRGLVSGIVVAVVLFLIYLPIAIFLGGVVRTYVSTAWTLTFRRLTGRGPGSVVPVPVPPVAPPPPPLEPSGL